MFAQYRPDIVRAVEETVANLKGLEHTIEILRNDLAWLAQSIGHPQAAQIALTPTRSLVANPALAGTNPLVQAPYATPYGFTPQIGAGPMAVPFGAYAYPSVVSPFAGYPQTTSHLPASINGFNAVYR